MVPVTADDSYLKNVSTFKLERVEMLGKWCENLRQ